VAPLSLMQKIESLAVQDIPAAEAAASLGLSHKAMTALIKAAHLGLTYTTLRRSIQRRRLDHLYTSVESSHPVPLIPVPRRSTK
jgi:hypothetical protein